MTPSPRHPDLDALLVHASWARDLARGLVTDPAAADDLVQEAWVAALESPPRHAENLRGWLGTVIRNLARSRGRSHGRRAAREAQVALEDHQEAPSSEALASRIDTQRRLASAVLELDEPYRSTVILRFYEGLDATQIANRLGVAPSTARWRIKVGLDTLREQLDRDFDGDRAAWVALVLPLARPRLAPASTAAVATTTLQGLIALKLTTKTAAIAAVALLGITGVALVVDPLASDGESPDNTPAPVTFSPLEESAPRVVEANAMAVSREVVEAAPTESTTDQVLVAARTTTFASMRLVDPDGLPVEGATAWSPKLPSADTGVTSDADGSVSIPLPRLEQRESVYIRIDHPNFARLTLYNVVEPERVTEFGDVILQPAGSVEGRVLLADGRPASGAWVEAALSAFEGDAEDRAYGMARRKKSERSSQPHADELGYFRLDRVPAGVLRFWAGLDEHLATLSAPVEVRHGTLSSGVEIRLGTLDADDFITGEVRLPDGSPAANAMISTRYSQFLGGSGSSSFTADADGRFRIAARPGAVYRIRAIDSDQAYGSAEESDLSAGDHATFQLEAERFFELFLTHDGSSFTRAEVWAADPQSGRYVVAPSAIEVVDDHYRIAIPEGEFVVNAMAEGFAMLEAGPFDEGTVPSQVTAELTAIAGLRGRVLIDGQPVAGARVSASPIARQTVEADGFRCLVDPFSRVTGTTDDAGNFSLTIREARTWVVRAEIAGQAPSETAPLDFDPAVGIEGIELSLTSGGSIEGRVMENGRPAAGRIVAASRGDGHPTSTRSDADGIYRFEHLMPGRWQVQRAEDDLVPGNSTMSMWGDPITEADLPWNCTVTEGQVTNFDLLTGPRPTLVGRLTFDGRGPGAWSAQLMDDADPIVRDNKVRVAADGSFTIEVPSEGRYRLMISADSEECGLTTEIDLYGSRVDWTRDLPAGAFELSGIPVVDGSGGAGAIPEMMFALARVDDLMVLAPIPPGVFATHTLESVPAGDYVVRSGPPEPLSSPESLFDFGRERIEFQVEPGERVLVTLPKQDD